jgi:hypothetical protein
MIQREKTYKVWSGWGRLMDARGLVALVGSSRHGSEYVVEDSKDGTAFPRQLGRLLSDTPCLSFKEIELHPHLGGGFKFHVCLLDSSQA